MNTISPAGRIPTTTRAWLGGLIAGEGCFHITKRGSTLFELSLRADDRGPLDTLLAAVGAGKISAGLDTGEKRGRRNMPMFKYAVTSLDGCLAVVELLGSGATLGPCKKAEAYKLWRKVVLAREQGRQGGRTQKSVRALAGRSKAEMSESVRAYTGPSFEELSTSSGKKIYRGAADHRPTLVASYS